MAEASLPDEIWSSIFGFTDRYTVCVCMLACRRFLRIAREDSVWKSLSNRDEVLLACLECVETGLYDFLAKNGLLRFESKYKDIRCVGAKVFYDSSDISDFRKSILHPFIPSSMFIELEVCIAVPLLFSHISAVFSQL